MSVADILRIAADLLDPDESDTDPIARAMRILAGSPYATIAAGTVHLAEGIILDAGHE